MIMDNRKTIEAIDAAIKRLQERRAALMPCKYATRTGRKVKCKSCGGAKYIFCSVKKQKINENLCNSKCDNYVCGDE
jgi:hypothetical protein